jgi:hypothetical protein
MAIDFPNSPALNQTFTSGGRVWIWDGAKWTPASTSGSGFLPLSGGTMTGELLLAADPTAALDSATKQYVDAGVASAQYSNYGGFVNKLRNGTMDVWQRGTSIAIGPGTGGNNTADGWWVISSGGASTALQAAGRGPTLYSLQVNGVAGVTAMTVLHKIESFVSAALGVASVTFQAQIYNATAASITPTLTARHPSTQDTWPSPPTSAPVDVGPVNLQSCPAGAWTRVAYTFTVPQASASLGLHVELGFGALTTASVRIAEADLRATPNLPVGLCANPPPPELRPIETETTFCQRYYYQSTGNAPGAVFFNGSVTSGSAYQGVCLFKVRMRASPSVTLTPAGSNTGFANAVGSIFGVGPDGVIETRSANATSSAGYFSSNVAASAEL